METVLISGSLSRRFSTFILFVVVLVFVVVRFPVFTIDTLGRHFARYNFVDNSSEDKEALVVVVRETWCWEERERSKLLEMLDRLYL